MSDFRRSLLVATMQNSIKIIRVYQSSEIDIPANCKYMDLFVVGGGGGGGTHSHANGRCGCGGNGGEVMYFPNVTTSVRTVSVTIGAGGGQDEDGHSSSCIVDGTAYVANGGSRGRDMELIYDNCPSMYNGDWITFFSKTQSVGNLGGYGCIWGSEGAPGQDGTICPFISDGKRYGASGAGGSDCFNISSSGVLGGDTGGGRGGYGADNAETNTGGDATFYGGGGGGGGFNSEHVTGAGGSGFQGFVAIAFHC